MAILLMKTNNRAVCETFWLMDVLKVSDIFGQNNSNHSDKISLRFRTFSDKFSDKIQNIHFVYKTVVVGFAADFL